MRDLGAVDALWFASHPEETHRIRPATEEEAAAFRVVRLAFPKLMTVVRRSDGASTSVAVPAGDDIERAADFELAGWFDADLDAAADLPP
ncbi:hypothetical protein ASG52_19815 [Methylobacterium sp. Leaf456]|uniref:hypothetical protein n=1 Tax=Methylobacterium sp. Leaf456 TaxID=1736382 RepID=UPI0006FA337E|nr:hypothetical protein [Methylobacterium sp. Leaf456]KQT59975.1 hypothetical protein ASG52_19815 [Methylobacterium sp. Leaf456]